MTVSAHHLQLISARRAVKPWNKLPRGSYESLILAQLSCEHLQALEQPHPTLRQALLWAEGWTKDLQRSLPNSITPQL